MKARLVLALVLLAGCAVDTGVVPSNRFVDRDIEAARRADARDVRDLRAIEPGLPPPSRGAATFAPF